jgi:hypothetical protein
VGPRFRQPPPHPRRHPRCLIDCPKNDWRVSDRVASPLWCSELGTVTEEAFGGGLERAAEAEGPQR